MYTLLKGTVRAFMSLGSPTQVGTPYMQSLLVYFAGALKSRFDLSLYGSSKFLLVSIHNIENFVKSPLVCLFN